MKITLTFGDAVIIKENGELEEIKIEDKTKNNYNFGKEQDKKYENLKYKI